MRPVKSTDSTGDHLRCDSAHQFFVPIRVLEVFGVLPYFGQIGIFFEWERAVIELSGAVWVLEALNVALVGANVDEKSMFSEKYRFGRNHL